jgi:hypothetical protein
VNIELCDVVGSITSSGQAAANLSNSQFTVIADSGLPHKNEAGSCE